MRNEIKTIEEFLQLSSEDQLRWRQIVMTTVVVAGVTETIDDFQFSKFEPTLEYLNEKLGEIVVGNDDFTKNYLSPEVEAILMIEGSRAMLNNLGWSL